MNWTRLLKGVVVRERQSWAKRLGSLLASGLKETHIYNTAGETSESWLDFVCMLRIETRLFGLDKRYERTKGSKAIYLGQRQCSLLNRKYNLRYNPIYSLEIYHLMYQAITNQQKKKLRRKLPLYYNMVLPKPRLHICCRKFYSQ